MLHYFANIITYRVDDPARQRDCDLTLVQAWRARNTCRSGVAEDLGRRAAR